MFLQQKLMTPATKKEQGKGKQKKDDNPMAGMTQSMQWTMPIMFGFFSLQFQAGLSIYFSAFYFTENAMVDSKTV